MNKSLLPGHGVHATRYSHSAEKTNRDKTSPKAKRFRLRYRWWFLLLPLLVALLWRLSQPKTGDTFVIPQPEGARTNNGLDVWFSFDDSGSTDTTDPTNLRYRAANFAARFLACQAMYDNPDRVGVSHFTGVLEREGALPLTAIPELVVEEVNTVCSTDRDFTDGLLEATPKLRAALTRYSSGGTAFVEVLRDAERNLRTSGGRTRVLFFFTDGFSSETVDQLRDAIKPMNGVHIYLLLLDADGEGDRIIKPWRSAGVTNIIRMSRLRGNRLDCTFAKIITKELDMQWNGKC